jgi:hypothetical protein
MQFRPTIEYPESEKPSLDLLENLFRDWHQHFASNNSGLEKHVADGMVFDGFYPYYFSQKQRILFVGREALDIAGLNYLDTLYKCYRIEKMVGEQPLNQNKFHARMMYIAYGIMNGYPAWPAIPSATKIGDTFGTEGGLSFAFMNISKLSNESGGWSADWSLIDRAYRLSTEGRNFIQEELAILRPHIVITMNLGDKTGSLGRLTKIHASENATSSWLDTGDHRALLVDAWHFSAPGKNDIAHYYEPICDALRRSGTGAPA